MHRRLGIELRRRDRVIVADAEASTSLPVDTRQKPQKFLVGPFDFLDKPPGGVLAPLTPILNNTARRRYAVGGEHVANMEARMGYLEGRMEEQSNMLKELRASFRHLDDKITRQFMWTIGIQITTFVAILVAVFSQP